MSNPSFSNIDLWLFELAEGNLSPKQIEQLELFLLQHPELDVDRDVWEMAKIQKGQFQYPQMAQLERKRPVAMYITAASVIVFALVTAAIWMWMENTPIHQLAKVPSDTNRRMYVRTVYLEKEANTPMTVQTANMDEVYSGEGYNTMIVTQASSVQGSAGNSFVRPVQPRIVSNQIESNQHTAESALEANTETVNDRRETINSLSLNPPVELSNDQDIAELIPMENYSVESSAYNNDPIANQEVEFLNGSNLDEESTNELNDHADEESLLEGEDQLIGSEGFNQRGGNNNHLTYSSDYKNSLKSRISAFGRKVQRMMDNPVALKNFKDPHYHVPGLSSTDIAFSSTGTMLATRVQTMSRLQWYGSENQLLSNQLAVDGYAYGLRGGIGIQLNHNYYANGTINDANAAVTYSPKFSISRKVSIEPSLRFKMGTKALTASKVNSGSAVEMERGNAYDLYPEQTPIGKTLWYKDMGAGVMVNTEWFFAGIQMDNLFRHEDNIYQVDFQNPQRANYHVIATVGTDWVSKKENLGLSPYIVYQNYGRLNEAWAGMNFRWNWLTVGGAVSTGLEPAASLGLKFEHFTMTYNIDYTESRMTNTKNLSHQLTLRFLTKPSRVGKRLLNL